MTHTRGELFDPVFGAHRLAEELSDRAWVRALLDVEAALARAAATVGLISADDAAAVNAAADELAAPGGIDLVDLGERSAAGGNPVIPLVKTLRVAVRQRGGSVTAVHLGATSQDIVDCALMLLSRRAGVRVLGDLRTAADSAAALADEYRATPMVARTLGQQALPTTFGVLAVSWFTGLDAAAVQLDQTLTELPVQFGGAAGTLAAVHPHGPALADALADELGLARQLVPWHTTRIPIATLTACLGVAAGAVSKAATDIVLMATTELGEVAEQAPGGSSTMPHKQNPIAAITARAAAQRVPGLVATQLGAMDHEFARAAGAWHAEWPTLTDLWLASGGAAHRLSTSLAGLRIHPDAMARNLDLTGGQILAERVTAALAEHIDDAAGVVAEVATSGVRIEQAPAVTAHLGVDELRRLLDPSHYLGHALDLVDHALSARNPGAIP